MLRLLLQDNTATAGDTKYVAIQLDCYEEEWRTVIMSR